MNLPDSMDKKKGSNGHQMKTNQDMLMEMQQKKKEALSKVNSKFSNGNEIANKSAEELNQMKLMVPKETFEHQVL